MHRLPTDPTDEASPPEAPPPGPPLAEGQVVPRTVPLIEESAHVDKLQIDRGGYRVTKRIEQHEQQLDVSLQRQRVAIERRPIGEWVREMPPIRHDGDTLIVPLVEEVLVTEKRLRLVEEVHIRQIQETRHTSIPVTLRKDTIEIERLAPPGPVDAEPN
jgi:uncharacterized protein (TIGR02271 family)